MSSGPGTLKAKTLLCTVLGGPSLRIMLPTLPIYDPAPHGFQKSRCRRHKHVCPLARLSTGVRLGCSVNFRNKLVRHLRMFTHSRYGMSTVLSVRVSLRSVSTRREIWSRLLPPRSFSNKVLQLRHLWSPTTIWEVQESPRE